MQDGQYLLPTEFALVLGFVLLPAVVGALAVQAIYLGASGALATSPGKSALALASTAVLGMLGAAAVFILSPASWGRTLGIREVAILGQHLPIWPLGFIILGVAAWLTTHLLRSSRNGEA